MKKGKNKTEKLLQNLFLERIYLCKMQESPQDFGIEQTTLEPQTVIPAVLPPPPGPSPSILESERQERFPERLTLLSVMEIGLGIVCISLGIGECMKLHFWSKTFASGICVGCVILIAGIFCFFSATRPKSNCTSIANIVSSAISVLVSVGEIVIAGLGIAYYRKGLCASIWSNYYYSYYGSRRYTLCSEYPDSALGFGIYGTLISLMVIQIVIAVIAAVYSFKFMSGDMGERSQSQMPLVYYPDNMQPMVAPSYYMPAQPGSMAPYQIQANQRQFFTQVPYSTSANATGLAYTTTNGCQIASQNMANNSQMADVTKTDLAASDAAQ